MEFTQQSTEIIYVGSPLTAFEKLKPNTALLNDKIILEVLVETDISSRVEKLPNPS